LPASLIAGTLVVVRWLLLDRLAALEQEVAFLRSTRNLDIPALPGEFRTFVGSASATLELARANAMLAELCPPLAGSAAPPN
jgi:hypothetical protein